MAVDVSTITSLYELAVEVRTVAETSLAATTEGVPSLSYVTPARPAFDCCPALIVWVPGLQEEPTSPLSLLATGHRASYGRINGARLAVIVLRCAPPMPTNGDPNVVANQAVASQVLQDGWALWTGFYTAIKEETFKDKCSEVFFEGGSSVDEQGQCVGWLFTLRAMLHGIA